MENSNVASHAPVPPVIPPRARTRPGGKSTSTTNLAHKSSSESCIAPSPITAMPASEEPAATRSIYEGTDASAASSMSVNEPQTPASTRTGGNMVTTRRSNESNNGYFVDKKEIRAPVHEVTDVITPDLQRLGLGESPMQRVPREAKRQSSTMSLPTTAMRAAVASPRSSSLTGTSDDSRPPLRLASSSPASPQAVESVTPPLGSQFKLGLGPAPAGNIAVGGGGGGGNERRTSDNSVNTLESTSSCGNASFVTAEHGLAPLQIRIPMVSVPGPSGNGYVSARVTRELERQKEVTASRKKQMDTSVGVVVKEDGTVIRDGFKIVDGVAKKSSSSGVYTPPTFPGPSSGLTHTSTRPSTSPFGPASESMFSHTSRSSMSSTRSSSFLANHLPHRKSDGRKSSFGVALSSLTSPLMSSSREFEKQPKTPISPVTPVTPATPSSGSTAESGRMSSDAWRASPLYSPARGQPDRYRSPVAVNNRHRNSNSGGDGGHPDRSSLNGVYGNDSGRFAAPLPRQMRALSEALNGCTTTDGYGLGLGFQVRDLDATPRSVSEGGPQLSSAIDLERGTTASKTSIPLPPRPRNVKGLSLPLTTAAAVGVDPPLRSAAVIGSATTEEATSPQDMETPATPGSMVPKMTSASKGVKRKPVPVMGQAV